MRFPMPQGWGPPAPGQVAPTRDAATVVLLRDTDAGAETYLLRRQPTMVFAAGMSVFPGGAVQAGDEESIGWFGPSPEEWAERLRCAPGVARALVVAAVRETFEESGILLAGPDERTTAAGLGTEEWGRVRVDLDQGRRSLANVLDEQGWALRADLLGAWAHWITPAFEPKRYDTRFFVAAVPEGQAVGPLPSEADRSQWTRPAAALDAVRAGEMVMLPPTIAVCRDLAGVAARDVVGVAADRVVEPIEPQAVQVDGAWFIENPLEDL
ncbi:MAG: NUDIX hydrolase [Aeromicrobium sp.]|uniref:NUDIX hydrolase n=1 Tax=Aeromicrobium sp. TaxID=1871063 RepID=UPI0039E5C4D6